MEISSTQNPAIKNILKLSKRRERLLQDVFVIEGAREFSLALAANYTFSAVFVCPQLFSASKYPDVLRNVPEEIITRISENVFQKIAYRQHSDGLVALARPKTHALRDLNLSRNPFVIILQSVEKPGNLGAILRTADAASVDAVIVCDARTDLYNPNVVRSSVGTLFTVQTAIASSRETLAWLAQNNIAAFAAELTAAIPYQEVDFKSPCAIVMGTEAEGLTDFWLQHARKRIKIPMRGKIDSLNVSVSTAVLTFEAMRQRGF